jgi:Tfp pilus assembly protein PilN
MAVKKEVSLLPNSENPNSFSSRLIKWSTTTGRVVIIFTELIVVCAFISRFWLDRKNSDLSEILRQKTSILQNTQAFESEFKQLQQKLSSIKSFYANQPKYDQQLDSLIKSTPEEIYYKDINITQDEKTSETIINSNLIAYREDLIVNFITNLMVNPDIKQVDIKRIEKKSKENQYDVIISLVFNSPKTNGK